MINRLLDEIAEPLSYRKNLENLKSQMDVLRPGISVYFPSVSDKDYIRDVRDALVTLGKLLSGWQGALKAIQSFPTDIQAGLTRVEQSALPDYSGLIAAALKKVEELGGRLA